MNRNHTVPSKALVRNRTKMMAMSSRSSSSKVVIIRTGVTVMNKVQILINFTTIIKEGIVVMVMVMVSVSGNGRSFDRVEEKP